MADDDTTTTTTAPPADDPTKAELEQLRKEKADRDKADRDARDAELTELRTFKKAREDEDAKRVLPPKTKAEKAADPPPDKDETKATDKPKKSRVSRRWFGKAADDD